MPQSLPRWRRYAVTVIDAAAVVAGSAACVVLLGGRTRFTVGGTRVILHSALPLAETAAVLLLARLALAGLARALPAVTAPPVTDDDRRPLLHASPLTRRVLWYMAAAAVGSLVWELPQLLHLRSVPDPYDPVFSAWRLAALAHQIATNPLHLWDANIFYPLPLTLTYSDATILQGLLGAPFIWAGANPLVVANLLMVISFPARGLAFFLLGWRLTDDPQVALLTALLGAWSPFYAQHHSQLEMQWTMFVPIAVLLFLRVMAAPRARTGWLLGATIAAQCLSCMYVAVMLTTWFVPFAFIVVAGWRIRPSRSLALALAAAAVLPLCVAAALGLPYSKARHVHGDWNVDVVQPFSAEARDYGDIHPWLSTYAQSPRGHHAERELFPGSSTLALAAAALPAPGTVTIAALVSGAWAVDWSLGLNGLTYDDLRRYVSPFRGIRVPARFAVLVDTSLVILGIWGVRRILRVVPERRRGVACGALALLILFDLRVTPTLRPYPGDVPGIYRSVTRDMILAELPEKDHAIDYAYFSTTHWAHLIGGYSGFFPPRADFDRATENFPSPDAVATFHRLGATHLTYNCAFERSVERCQNTLALLDANPSLAIAARGTWRGAEVRLYRYR